MQENGRGRRTNEVGRNFAIAKSSGGDSSGEIPAVGWKIGLGDAGKVVVVARVHDGIPEHYHGWNCFILW